LLHSHIATDRPALRDLGLLGDTRTAALVDVRGRIVWLCLPHFDGEPVFGALVAGEGGGVFALGPAGDAEVVDCAGHFVLPGLINAHMHTWQTALRSVAANWTLLEYFRHVHAGLATVFTPEDIHVATLAGALNQLDHGVTTLVDWCHNNPTPEHTDAGIAGLKESGIRAAFFHGSPKPDPKPGEPHFSEVPHPRKEIERLVKGPLSDRSALVTLGMAVLGPHYSTLDVSDHDFALAKELCLVASMHQGGGEAKTPGGWETLVQRGLVGPHINIVHGNNLTDGQLKAFVDLGVSFSVLDDVGHAFGPESREVEDVLRQLDLGLVRREVPCAERGIRPVIVEMAIFVGVLALGLLYAWRKRALIWQ